MFLGEGQHRLLPFAKALPPGGLDWLARRSPSTQRGVHVPCRPRPGAAGTARVAIKLTAMVGCSGPMRRSAFGGWRQAARRCGERARSATVQITVLEGWGQPGAKPLNCLGVARTTVEFMALSWTLAFCRGQGRPPLRRARRCQAFGRPMSCRDFPLPGGRAFRRCGSGQITRGHASWGFQI